VKFSKTFAKLFWAARAVLGALILLEVVFAMIISWIEPINFGDAVYMTFITSLTIGYGDFVPVTPLGKTICVIVAFTGMLFLGLAVAIGTQALRMVFPRDKSL